ncbi:hypothetical protein KOY49_01960 [Candidatus Minimicrobia vallesae]|uniref:UvrD-like helicase C-terminal domain-containing protein n=1 Tax=Candidatus Minimicrobia vallesae TaxID=2841264 RepID=A0A8F1SAQ5_9BACT|nr:3'-5' exonuclease [Candidatus Minimicrobia vallesae]QWQ31744.1 hypothetical protein KOY49_01960 [Candidatus Minimicrobia vallesae]
MRTLRQKLRDRITDKNPTLEDFLEFIDLHISTKTRLTQIRTHASSLSGAINLMTAHKSKGLEFPHVFVIGAIDSAWGEKVRTRSRAIPISRKPPTSASGRHLRRATSAVFRGDDSRQNHIDHDLFSNQRFWQRHDNRQFLDELHANHHSDQR